MRRSIIVIGVSLLSALVAGATDIPKMEAFVGYNFVRFNPNSDFAPSYNSNGGSGQFIYNFNHWLGAAADIGAVTKGVINHNPVDTTTVHFLVGPRFTMLRHHSRFLPFAHVLFGGAYATASTPVSAVVSLPPNVTPPIYYPPLNTPFSARIHASDNGFAMMAGGGIDVKMSKHLSFRPLGADYYLTRIPSFFSGDTTNRNNFRYSAGVTFLFGAQ
jgi:hypothetical protein